MPLPNDPKIVTLGEQLLAQLEVMAGSHAGMRPVHARGVLLQGVFTPSAEGVSITRAPHISDGQNTPVTARFSSSTGDPHLPDNDPRANPRGFALRFHLAERVHTDIIGHAADGFPTRTGEEFLEFVRAAAASSGPAVPSPTPLEVFLATHPAARAFSQKPKPSPSSFAKEQFFGVHALRFINKDGVVRNGRYRITPDAGIEHLWDSMAKNKDANFLFDELNERIAAGPIGFHVMVQIADESDIVNDSTVHWPEHRPLISLGQIALTALVPNQGAEQKHIIFDPIPRVDGIEPSSDPLLELRAAVYLMSGRRRREAPVAASAATA